VSQSSEHYEELPFNLKGIQDNFEISIKGINDVLLKVGDACKNEYDLKIEKIRNAKWRHIDETGFKVNGQKWWLWNFQYIHHWFLVFQVKTQKFVPGLIILFSSDDETNIGTICIIIRK